MSSRYDGQRAQIHRLADGSIRVFSRNGDETTSRFPDLVDIVIDSCVHAAVTFILDAEVNLYSSFSLFFYYLFSSDADAPKLLATCKFICSLLGFRFTGTLSYNNT